MMIHLQVHQVLPAQVLLQTILCPIQMIQAHHHRALHHLHLQAAVTNLQIHPAQAPVLAQALNPLTAAKNTTNQNHLP